MFPTPAFKAKHRRYIRNKAQTCYSNWPSSHQAVNDLSLGLKVSLIEADFMVMGICFSIWPLGNGCSIWQKRKWCDRAFSPSAFKNSNGETAASAYGNVQMLRHPLVLQLLNPIQNYNSGWWFSSFRLHVIWPLIAMNVAEPVKCLDIPVRLCRNKCSKNAQMRPRCRILPNQAQTNKDQNMLFGNSTLQRYMDRYFIARMISPAALSLCLCLMLMRWELHMIDLTICTHCTAPLV